VLLAKISPCSVIGFQNPMIGILNEDIFPLVQESTLSLVDKDLIQVDGNNLIQIAEPLNSYINTISAPITTVLVGLRLKNNKNQTVQSYQFSGHEIILLDVISDFEYRISKLTSKEELVSRICAPFTANIFWAPDSKDLYFTQSLWEMIQHNLEIGHLGKAKELLDSTDGDTESKSHLFNTLKTPMINFSFVGFFNRNDASQKYVDGFAVICDDRYVWILEMVDEKKQIVKIAKTTLSEINRKIVTKTSSIPRLL
jgi:hypothetical protein